MSKKANDRYYQSTRTNDFKTIIHCKPHNIEPICNAGNLCLKPGLEEISHLQSKCVFK